MNYYVPLLADNMYHITAHAVGSEKLFLNEDNYRFFLSRFDKYISPVADIFAWSLLPNHFHLLIQVKPLPELIIHYKKIKPHVKAHENWQPEFVMKRFSNLFNSYAKSFNLKNKRRGALFMDYMRRVEVKTDPQFTATVFYIHKNAVHHGYCRNIADWPWSSYKTILSKSPAKIERQKVLDHFGGTERFVEYHSQPVFLKYAAAVEYENQIPTL